MKIKLFFWIVVLIFLLVFTKGNAEEQIVLLLKIGVDVDILDPNPEGECIGPNCFAINANQTKVVVADPLKSKLLIYDLKNQKLTVSFDTPCMVLKQVLFSPDDDVVYLSGSDNPAKTFNIIRKVSPEGRLKWELRDNAIPKAIQDEIVKNHFNYYSEHYKDYYDKILKKPYKNPRSLYWKHFTLNGKGDLFVATLSSVLKYTSKGELVGVVPGMGYPFTPYLFRLDDGGELYTEGGELQMFDEKKVKMRANLPRNRIELPDFQGKTQYHKGSLIEIAGVDSANNIYLQEYKPTQEQKSSNLMVYKFDVAGTLLKTYLLTRPVGYFRKGVQIMTNGTIYYWKYHENEGHIELRRITQ